MAKEKTKKDSTPKIEREYTIPLREKCRVVPRYKKSNKAIKTIKEFVVRHMGIRDGDLKKVRIDKSLNEEVWARGIRKPPSKVRVKVTKQGDIVIVELANLSTKQKNKLVRLEKRETKAESTKKKKPTAPLGVPQKSELRGKKPDDKSNEKQDKEKKTDVKEKQKSGAIAEQKLEKTMQKQAKHQVGGKTKQPKAPVRKVLND